MDIIINQCTLMETRRHQSRQGERTDTYQYGPEKRTRRDPYPLVYHRDHYTPVETRRHPYTLVYYQRPIDTSSDQKTPIHTSILPETIDTSRDQKTPIYTSILPQRPLNTSRDIRWDQRKPLYTCID